jgi:hypothetical protein
MRLTMGCFKPRLLIDIEYTRVQNGWRLSLPEVVESLWDTKNIKTFGCVKSFCKRPSRVTLAIYCFFRDPGDAYAQL